MFKKSKYRQIKKRIELKKIQDLRLLSFDFINYARAYIRSANISSHVHVTAARAALCATTDLQRRQLSYS